MSGLEHIKSDLFNRADKIDFSASEQFALIAQLIKQNFGLEVKVLSLKNGKLKLTAHHPIIATEIRLNTNKIISILNSNKYLKTYSINNISIAAK